MVILLCLLLLVAVAVVVAAVPFLLRLEKLLLIYRDDCLAVRRIFLFTTVYVCGYKSGKYRFIPKKIDDVM